MAQVTYLGPHDAVEVPHLLHLGKFENGVAKEVPDDELGNLADQETWHVELGNSTPAAPEPAPVEPAPAESEPNEGS